MSTTTHEQAQTIWKTMLEQGVGKITVSFSGGGDDGQIDEVDWEYDPKSGYAYVANHGPIPHALKTIVESLSEDILNRGEIPDWVNNEGGRGTIDWILNEDGSHLIDVSVSVAVIEYENYTFNYDTDDDGFIEISAEAAGTLMTDDEIRAAEAG